MALLVLSEVMVPLLDTTSTDYTSALDKFQFLIDNSINITAPFHTDGAMSPMAKVTPSVAQAQTLWASKSPHGAIVAGRNCGSISLRGRIGQKQDLHTLQLRNR